MSTEDKKAYVGMSGGVDSSVSAALLKEAGYEVTGVFIKVWQPDFLHCTWREDRQDAMRVAASLGISFKTLDLEKEYKREVVDYMISEYKAGRTPNPDVMCNKHVKFGAFYDWALEEGADVVATGHYARVSSSEDMRASSKSKVQSLKEKMLLKGADQNKDQTYFIWNLKQEQLAHIKFPIGEFPKEKVREMARERELITAEKKDSQGLCFIGKVDMKQFLKEYIKTEEGDVLNKEGEVIGRHDGALLYTVGQRHGFTVTKKGTDEGAYYVIGKNVDDNTLIVSPAVRRKEEEIKVKSVFLEGINWIRKPLGSGEGAECRFRYRQKLLSCTFESPNQVTFDKSQTTIAVGQSLVFYKGEECLGGGVISSIAG